MFLHKFITIKVCKYEEKLRHYYLVSFFLPLLRLRLSTFLPPAELMRLRKP